MAKDKLTDYDSTASGNLDVGGVSVAEGMLPSGVNNAIRELMSHQADAFGAGTPLYVDQTNNRLGVGTASPNQKLEVSGTDARIYLTGANTDIAMDNSANGQLHLDGNAYGFGIALNTTGAQLYTNSASRNLIFGVNETEVMRVTNDSVEIISASADPLKVERNTAGNTAIQVTDGADTIYFGMPTGGGFAVDTDANLAATPLFKIDDVTGNVGIGTSSPSQEIHGYSSGGDFSLKLESASATGTAYTYYKNADREYATGIRGSASDAFQIIDITADATRLAIDTSGAVTTPSQPSFMVYKNADQTLTVGSNTTITWENELWDVGGNFASNTFTAPVTGKYYLQTQIRIDTLDTASTYYALHVTTSNHTKYVIIDPNFTSDLTYYTMNLGSVFDMDAGDTASVLLLQYSGTASHIDDSGSYTSFSGYLLG